LTLCQQNIDEVLTFGGLWQANEVATEIPAHVYLLHRERVVRVTKEYLEAAIVVQLHLSQIHSSHIFALTRRYS
jgi:hypothetical protein